MNRTPMCQRLPAMGRALAHRNFRLFVVGQGISVIGTWMQQIATVWLVYRLSQSSLLLGVADFTAQIPAALILPLAGVLTDRWNRHRTVLAAQSADDDPGLCPHGLDRDGRDQRLADPRSQRPAGSGQRLRCTARQSFVIEMVDHHDLGNAIAINSSVFNAARSARPGGRRHRDRAVRRVALLSLERPELPGGAGLAAGDAGPAVGQVGDGRPASWRG